MEGWTSRAERSPAIPPSGGTSTERTPLEFLEGGQTAFGDELPSPAADSPQFRGPRDACVAYRGFIPGSLAISTGSRITSHDMQTRPLLRGDRPRPVSRGCPCPRAARRDGRHSIRASLQYPVSRVEDVRRGHLPVSANHGTEDADETAAVVAQTAADAAQTTTERQVSAR